MFYLRRKWWQFRALFERQWINLNPESSLRYDEMVDRAWERGSVKVDEEWDKVRSLVLRCAAAGAVAALTLIGSQSLGPSTPKVAVFWTFVWFLGGLGALGVRQLLMVWHAMVRRKGTLEIDVLHVGYAPPPILGKAARCVDVVALTITVVGVIKGLCVLYGLTQPV